MAVNHGTVLKWSNLKKRSVDLDSTRWNNIWGSQPKIKKIQLSTLTRAELSRRGGPEPRENSSDPAKFAKKFSEYSRLHSHSILNQTMQSINENSCTRRDEHKENGFKPDLHQEKSPVTELCATVSRLRSSRNGNYCWTCGCERKMMVILETRFVDDFEIMVVLVLCVGGGITKREWESHPQKGAEGKEGRRKYPLVPTNS